MKLKFPVLTTSLMFIGSLFGQQSNQAGRLFVPYLDEGSQSNVIVTISGVGQPCPPKYTNKLSNTNLFTLEEQKLIGDIFKKYKNVTTNSGPPSTVLVDFYTTNSLVRVKGGTVNVENWVACFQYTNSDAQELVRIGKGGLLAKFRNKSGDGYNASFVRTGDGTMLRFSEEKKNLIDGIFAAFEDMHWQGTNWDFRLADFSNCRLTEYRRYSNGMVLGKYLMWDPRNNNLFLEAEFKKPYDFEKHRIDLKLFQQHSQ